MNKISKLILLLAAIVCAVPMFGGTYYSKVTASTESGNGKVYVSPLMPKATPGQITATTHSAVFKSGGLSASSQKAEHAYYIVASGDAEYGFQEWNDGKTENPRRVVVVTAKSTENDPQTANYTAKFAPTALAVVSSDYHLGWPVISKSINVVGDNVKLSIAYAVPSSNGEFGSYRKSNSVVFDGWYDSDGNLISDAETLDYNITRQETITARFNHDLVLDKEDLSGYYRLGTPSYYKADAGKQEFLSIVGNIQYPLNDKTQLNTDIQATKSMSNPAAVFYVTGSPNLENIRSKAQRADVATGIDATAQGVAISHIVKGKELKLQNSPVAGRYIIADKSASVTLQKNYDPTIWVTSDKPGNTTFSHQGDFDVQPVDEAHVDVNYFGAEPDASMVFEGGYWTSMYASFPYRCYEPDGVEAYYISEINTDFDAPIAVLTKIDNGIVPAATPVLLKCQGLTPKENRLIPLVDEPAPLPSNMLRGEYQLNESADNPNHVVFDAARMRVFGVSSAGQVGFYKLAEGTELAANKAWLDVSGLSAAQASRIVLRHDVSGVDNVVVDGTFPAGNDNRVYDLMGRPVDNPVPGTIYVCNGRKFIAR